MIVLDASALVDVIADRPAKDAVLAHLDQPISAPAHQLAEVSSALMRLLRAGDLSVASARRALTDAATLEQDIVPTDAKLLQRAFSLRESIRILDGLYVAVAERLGCPLLTTDGRLTRADPPCEVVFAEPAS